MTEAVRAADLAAVEAYFRRSGLPHLTADDRVGDRVRRWRWPAVVVAWIVLAALFAVLDLRWWVGVLVGLAIPVLAAALGYLLVALGIRVLAVGATVSVAFIAFGTLIVDRALTAEWVGVDPHVLLSVSLAGREVIVSEALVRVATTLGAFAALYFTAVALGESRNREEFLDDELERVGRAMAAWSYYVGALSAPAGSREGDR